MAPSDKAQGDKEGHGPSDTKRSCTDFFCVLVFLGALVGLFLCIYRAASAGDLHSLITLPDFQGQQCGENGKGSYTFFCANGLSVDLSHQVCVDTCPDSTSVLVNCWDAATSTFQETAAYPTIPLAGMLCMPTAGDYYTQVRSLIGENEYLDAAMEVAEALRQTELMGIAAVMSVLCCLVYLFLIDKFAKLLVYIGVGILSLIPAATGIYFIYVSQQPETNSAVSQAVDGLGVAGLTPEQTDLYLGIVFLASSFIILCVVCCKGSQLNKAAEAIEEAADCIVSMPTLLLEPFIAFFFQAIVFIPGVVGLLVLYTSGKDDNSAFPAINFSPDNVSLVCSIYYAFILLWVMDILNNISTFVVIYTAESWFFTHNRASSRGRCFQCSCGPTLMLSGYCSAVTYHLGSIIYGALLMSLLKGVRVVAQILMSASDPTGNPVSKCISRLVQCCLGCIQWVLDFTSKVAYCDVALNSVGYCEGVRHALSSVFSSGVQWTAVEGFTRLFVITGVGAISAGCGGLTWVLTTEVDRYKDSASPNYVSDPRSVAIAAALVGAFLSSVFLSIFDTVADTMAYCEGVMEYRKGLPAEDEEDGSRPCWNCFTPSAPETKRLLSRG